jgi:acyl transferase domain-containing protein/acyl carrier protein
MRVSGPLERALRAIETMQAKLLAAERRRAEPIAVVGLGCRLPGAPDPEAFRRQLREGRDAIGEVPPERWDRDALYHPDAATPGRMTVRHGGFLAQSLAELDCDFFHLSDTEAAGLDPQQRLLLEVSWEALEDACIPAADLFESACGAYVGAGGLDYALWRIANTPREAIDAYFATGAAPSLAAGRLAYFYGFTGPAMAIDTACSSSLVAIHQACAALRNRECDLALAGGVSVLLAPELSINFSRAGMLAPDGRCKAFAAAADGFGRAEGCGVLVLRRQSDAEAAGDRIRGLIRGSAVNQDGASGGLTVPSGPSQAAVIRLALRAAGLEPADVDYVEAHGTGTRLGDPIEIGALNAVFAGRGRPLYVGSVKTGIGHTEAAAGVAGVIKVLLAMESGALPPHLHLDRPNPHLDLAAVPIRIPAVETSWPAAGDRPRRAGVSSFGFSGTNAHLVIEQAPPAPAVSKTRPPVEIFTLSAADRGALRAAAGAYARCLAAAAEVELGEVCDCLWRGRQVFPHRLAAALDGAPGAAAEGRRALIEALGAFAAGSGDAPPPPGLAVATAGAVPRIAFLFAGQGSQYAGMGRALYRDQPVFRQAIERCEAALQERLGRSLLPYFDERAPGAAGAAGAPGAPGGGIDLDATEHCQPALFALEHGLLALWAELGVRPDLVMGHSAGEIAAATAAGVFDLADGLCLAAERGRLMGALAAAGAMAGVGAGEAAVQRFLAGWPDLSLAAVNARDHCVISGPAERVAAAVRELAGTGLAVQELRVARAFHSRQVEALLDDLGRLLATIPRRAPRLPLVSTVSGRLAGEEVATAGYWLSQARQPVRFAAGVDTLLRQGCRCFVELGPGADLLALVRRHAGDGGDLLLLASERRPADGSSHAGAALARSAAALHVHGVPLALDGVARQTWRRLSLPTYPFQRRRCWLVPAPAGDRPAAAPWPAAPEAAAAVGAALLESAYEVVWREVDGVPERAASRPPPAPWLVLCGADGFGARLAAALAAGGSRVVRLYDAGEAAADAAAGEDDAAAAAGPAGGAVLRVDLAQREAARERLRAVQPEHVVYACLPSPAEEVAARAGEAAERQALALLRLYQVLPPPGGRPRRWSLLTRGAQAAGGPGSLAAPAGGVVWGWGRALQAEHPELAVSLIDLDPAAGAASPELVAALLAEPLAEPLLALRGGRRLAMRLAPARPPAGRFAPRAEASYLITGGGGALGLLVAGWMLEQGARHLVLASRHVSPAALALAAGAAVRGAAVHCVAADAADAGAMAGVIADCTARGAPLAGIVHAAGALAGGLLEEQSDLSYRQALRGKVLGAWTLHRLTADLPLELFVCFSSAVTLLPGAGQSGYIAANAFLDGLARVRRGAGLAGCSIGWGPWHGAGMAASPPAAGWPVAAIAAPAALAAFARLGCGGAPHVALLPAPRWDAIRAGAGRAWTLFREVAPQAGPGRETAGPAGAEPELRLRLLALAPERRPSMLASWLARELAALLGRPAGAAVDPDRGFRDLGMDSILTVQLAARLAGALSLPVSGTLIFNHPTVGDLTARLLDLLDPAGGTEAAAGEPASDDEMIAYIHHRYGAGSAGEPPP